MPVTTSRRAIVGALAVAPVAALPVAVAVAADASCPALAAVGEYRRLKAIEDEAYARAAEVDRDIALRRDALGFVEIDGERIYTLGRLDVKFGVPRNPEYAREELGKALAGYRLQMEAERAPIPPEYFAARAKLEPIQSAILGLMKETKEADTVGNAAQDAALASLFDALRTPISSQAGAIEMLRVIADTLEELGVNEVFPKADFVPAMRRAIDALWLPTAFPALAG